MIDIMQSSAWPQQLRQVQEADAHSGILRGALQLLSLKPAGSCMANAQS